MRTLRTTAQEVIKTFAMAALFTAVLSGSAQEALRLSLRVALPALPASLDIGSGFSNTDHAVPYSIFDSLIHKDHTSVEPVYVPGLATSWERVSDRALELTLREGVTFHNGEPMTAEDVKFSLERFNLADHSPYAFPRDIAFGNIERVEVITPTTVRVVTVNPEPALEAILSMPQAAIIPKNNYTEGVGFEGFGLAPVGTGPYHVTEFIPEERISVEVFEDFWGEPPNASAITFRTIPELASRITALVNNEVDIITHVPPDQVAVIESQSCCETRKILSNIFHVIYFNSLHPVLQDEKVRQALNLAINRDLLVETLWGGEAVVPKGHQFPQFGKLYNPDRAEPAFDPERAQQLLSESSYNGKAIRYNIRPEYYTNGFLAAQAIIEMWKQVGVNAELNTNPDDYWDPEVMHVGAWSNPLYFTDPAGSYGVMWAPDGRRGSETSWTGEHGEYAEVYNRFRYNLDSEERRTLFQEVLDYWESFVPGTILYQPMEYYGIRRGVNWQPLPGSQTYILDFRADNLSFD